MGLLCSQHRIRVGLQLLSDLCSRGTRCRGCIVLRHAVLCHCCCLLQYSLGTCHRVHEVLSVWRTAWRRRLLLWL
jgi:hypothetical protein